MIKLKDILNEGKLSESANPLKVKRAFDVGKKAIYKSIRQINDDEFIELKKVLIIWLKQNLRGEGKLK